MAQGMAKLISQCAGKGVSLELGDRDTDACSLPVEVCVQTFAL